MINENLNLKKGMTNRGVILIISIVIILLVTIVIIVNNKNSAVKYNDGSIKKLLNKGCTNMQNLYVEERDAESGDVVRSLWFKDNMKKIKSTEGSYTISDLNSEKIYIVNPLKKEVIEKTLEGNLLENFSDKYSPYILNKYLSDDVKYEYIKEEKYQDKDCIVVKKVEIDSITGNELEGQSIYIIFYIEKDTGYLIGRGEIYEGKDDIVENVYYKNIRINELQDSDFEIPKDFVVIK